MVKINYTDILVVHRATNLILNALSEGNKLSPSILTFLKLKKKLDDANTIIIEGFEASSDSSDEINIEWAEYLKSNSIELKLPKLATKEFNEFEALFVEKLEIKALDYYVFMGLFLEDTK